MWTADTFSRREDDDRFHEVLEAEFRAEASGG
jgi:hypothetical protein